MDIQDNQLHELALLYLKLCADRHDISSPSNFAIAYLEISAEIKKAILENAHLLEK